MIVLRIASLAIASLWIGGLSVLVAVAAHTLPAALTRLDPVSGPRMADLVIGDIFARFQDVSWFLGGGLIILLGIRAALGPRPRRLAIQVSLVAAMLAANAFVLSTALITLTLGLGLAVFSIESMD